MRAPPWRWRGVGMFRLGLRMFPQIDKVRGLCAASQGTGLMADQWGAGGPSRVCWEQCAPGSLLAPPSRQVCV